MKNTDKVTLTIGQLKKLVKESQYDDPIKDFEIRSIQFGYDGRPMISELGTANLATLYRYAKKHGKNQVILDFDVAYANDDEYEDKEYWDEDGNQLPGVKIPINVTVTTFD